MRAAPAHPPLDRPSPLALYRGFRPYVFRQGGDAASRFSSFARAYEQNPGTERSSLNPTNYFYACMPIMTKKSGLIFQYEPRIGLTRSKSTDWVLRMHVRTSPVSIRWGLHPARRDVPIPDLCTNNACGGSAITRSPHPRARAYCRRF
jgi:hypothetical protein